MSSLGVKKVRTRSSFMVLMLNSAVFRSGFANSYWKHWRFLNVHSQVKVTSELED